MVLEKYRLTSTRMRYKSQDDHNKRTEGQLGQLIGEGYFHVVSCHEWGWDGDAQQQMYRAGSPQAIQDLAVERSHLQTSGGVSLCTATLITYSQSPGTLGLRIVEPNMT